MKNQIWIHDSMSTKSSWALVKACFSGVVPGVVLLALVGCQPSHAAKFPWGEAPRAPEPARADVRELNSGYRRTSSQVWVRQVTRPTRAALDYAAYHANFMIADPEPETPFVSGAKPQTADPFDHALEAATLTGDLAKLPLTPAERAQPLAFAPLSEFLQAHKVEGAAALADVGAAVRDEKWGLPLPPGSSGQSLSELYLHVTSGGATELWAKVEFQPWFKAFSQSSDQDGDGFPELYGKVRSAVAAPALVSAIQHQYIEPLLTPAEVKGWANQLSSYWYPSFNTDLIPPSSTFPDAQTESNIKQELAGRTFENPSIVLRGKPQGKPTYNVFLVQGAGPASEAARTSPALELKKTKPTPDPAPVAKRVADELTRFGGGSWEKWEAQVAPFRASVRKRLKAMPPKIKALAGNAGYLFYRNSLAYVAGGDLEKQPKGKNPIPIILAFKKLLDEQGVDFLFVPVPTKEEVYPEQLDPHFEFSGQIVNPSFRKFIGRLSEQGVEVVDLLPSLLAAKRAAPAEPEPLFQHQDTHWTDRGLELAADLIGARVKTYPWYAEVSRHAQHFAERKTTFSRFGDLQSRLPDAQQKQYSPESLVAEQVLRADNTTYDDDPDSPIVMLGDSFTGVYELTDAEHAGVSAHVARRVSYPLDLVMSYGGGPNVREKLLRRGVAALSRKKLVIWLMTARDLYNYWEDWAPLKEQ